MNTLMLIVGTIAWVGLATVFVQAKLNRVSSLRNSYERYLRTQPLLEAEIQAELAEWDAA